VPKEREEATKHKQATTMEAAAELNRIINCLVPFSGFQIVRKGKGPLVFAAAVDN